MKIKKTPKTPVAKTVVKKTGKCASRCCASKVSTKKDVTFSFHGEKGKSVYVAGEFNEWDPTAKKMAYSARTGIYSAKTKLAAGTYQYKFVIDGTWCADPENANAVPNDQGTFNSIVEVK